MQEDKCELCGLPHAGIGIEVRGCTLFLLGVFFESAAGWAVRTDTLDLHPIRWVIVYDRGARVKLSASVEKIRELGKPVDRFGGSILLKREHWQPVPRRIQEREQIKQGVARNENARYADRRGNHTCPGGRCQGDESGRAAG